MNHFCHVYVLVEIFIHFKDVSLSLFSQNIFVIYFLYINTYCTLALKEVYLRIYGVFLQMEKYCFTQWAITYTVVHVSFIDPVCVQLLCPKFSLWIFWWMSMNVWGIVIVSMLQNDSFFPFSYWSMSKKQTFVCFCRSDVKNRVYRFSPPQLNSLILRADTCPLTVVSAHSNSAQSDMQYVPVWWPLMIKQAESNFR